MAPSLALLLWLIFTLLLLSFDPARDRRASQALWIPLIWMFIDTTRLPSQWFSSGMSTLTASSLETGSPLDRNIDLLLIGISLAILMSREFDWGSFLNSNRLLIIFLFFALMSVAWSDFPFITFKRWTRDLETYLAVLVILTDPSPLRAIRIVLRRLAYVTVPLSILLIKYFPQMGRQYDSWTGAVEYVGAATSKNMLGLLCLIAGLFFVWDLATRWADRSNKHIRRIFAVNILFLALTLWVLHQAKSTTSTVCLALGTVVILVLKSAIFRRHPKLIKALIPTTFCLYLFLDFGLGMNGKLAEALGKSPTLTDRTLIWKFLLGMHTNPLIGVGYQSFWLGSRLATFWLNSGLGHINEAHNGYLETYLELGLVGLGIFIAFAIESYRVLCRRLSSLSDIAILGMAVWICFLFYNMSEAALDGGILYLLFLISVLRVPSRVASTVSLPRAKNNRPGSKLQSEPDYSEMKRSRVRPLASH